LAILSLYTIDFIGVQFGKIEFSHSLAVERTGETLARFPRRSLLALGTRT
jgi:hypothetical protein